MQGGPKIFISAGEAGGGHYWTLLIAALGEMLPDAEFFGLGGRRMEAMGFRLSGPGPYPPSASGLN